MQCDTILRGKFTNRTINYFLKAKLNFENKYSLKQMEI